MCEGQAFGGWGGARGGLINFTSRNVICDISSSPALGSGRCGEVLLTTLCRVSVYRNIKQNRREMREGVDDYKFTIIPSLMSRYWIQIHWLNHWCAVVKMSVERHRKHVRSRMGGSSRKTSESIINSRAFYKTRVCVCVCVLDMGDMEKNPYCDTFPELMR